MIADEEEKVGVNDHDRSGLITGGRAGTNQKLQATQQESMALSMLLKKNTSMKLEQKGEDNDPEDISSMHTDSNVGVSQRKEPITSPVNNHNNRA